MVDYYALSAKCRAIRSKMLTLADYEALASCGSLDKFEAYLSGFERYRECMLKSGEQARRAGMEHRMRRVYFSLYEKLALFAGGRPGEFFRRLLLRYEIVYIMRALNAIDGGVREKYADMPAYLLRHSRVNFPALGEATSYSAFTAALAGTEYYGAAAACLLGEEPDIKRFEQICYNEYYGMLLGEWCDALDKHSAAAARSVIGERIDISNILYAQRCAKFGFRHTDALISSVCTPERRVYLERIARGEETAPDAKSMAKAFYERAFATVSEGRADIGVPLSLLILAENELVNTTHIIEGIRYGVASNAIMEKIICR